MNNSEISSPKKLNNPVVWAVVGLILVFIGFLDASYLTAAHYTGSNVACYVARGCDIVTTSKYSKIGIIPISLAGLLYYLALGGLISVFIFTKSKRAVKLALGLVSIGFLVSLYLVYLQLFVIHALCLYCIISASISTIVFLNMILINRVQEKLNI